MRAARCVVAVVAGLLAAQLAFGQATLKVTSPAPPIKVAKWIKGEQVDKLERAKVYVVEFWATWCGPCRVSIPHITELAHKYAGKITFIGVDSFERPSSKTDTSYFAKVEQFVKEMGSQMDYSVCIDGPEGTMATTWMEAAGQRGIPTAFVVGKDGTIQWIGHPTQMDKVLDPVLAGTFDPKAAAAERERAEAGQAAAMRLMQPVYQAASRRDYKGALAAINKAIAQRPDMEGQLGPMKFNLLMQVDQKAMYPYARKLANGVCKNDAQALNALAWPMVDPKSGLKVRDYDTGLLIAQKAAKASNYRDPMILDTLAVAHYRKGQKSQAIQYEAKAVSLLDSAPGVPPDAKQQIRDTLARMKAGKY